jgi:hypothetical protein
VASVLNDTWEWLYRAEEARKAAEQLTDPDAKQCTLVYVTAGPILRWARASCHCTDQAAGRMRFMAYCSGNILSAKCGAVASSLSTALCCSSVTHGRRANFRSLSQ